MQVENPRQDILTRKSYPKSMLFRLYVDDGEVKIDISHKAGGRGCYLLKDKKTIDECEKKKVLEKRFKSSFSPAIYDSLRSLL